MWKKRSKLGLGRPEESTSVGTTRDWTRRGKNDTEQLSLLYTKELYSIYSLTTQQSESRYNGRGDGFFRTGYTNP